MGLEGNEREAAGATVDKPEAAAEALVAAAAVLHWRLTRDGVEGGFEVAGLAAPTRAFCGRAEPPLVCAHGGDSARVATNTLPAFKAAVAAGEGCLEVDSAATADGQLVVLHRRELAGMLAQKGWDPALEVGDLTYAEVLQLDASGAGDRVPTVRQVVALFQHRVRTLVLDVKTRDRADGNGDGVGSEADMARRVGALIREAGCGNCVAWAKADRVVRLLQAELAKAPAAGAAVGYVVANETAAHVAAGLHRVVEGRLEELAPAPEYVAVHHGMACPATLAAAHAAGRTVVGWTANTGPILRRLLDEGVDGIVSNYPRTVLRAVAAKRRACEQRHAARAEP